MTPERSIQNAILRLLSGYRCLRVWRANAGAASFSGQVVRFGVKGQADLTGILPGGRRLEIEVKTATGRQSKEQIAYQRMIESLGGVYILARSPHDVAKRLEQLGYPEPATPADRVGRDDGPEVG